MEEEILYVFNCVSVISDWSLSAFRGRGIHICRKMTS